MLFLSLQTTGGGVRQLRHEDRARGLADGAERGRGGQRRVSHLLAQPAARRPPQPPLPPAPPQRLRRLREAHVSRVRGFLHLRRHQGTVSRSFVCMYSLSFSLFLCCLCLGVCDDPLPRYSVALLRVFMYSLSFSLFYVLFASTRIQGSSVALFHVYVLFVFEFVLCTR